MQSGIMRTKRKYRTTSKMSAALQVTAVNKHTAEIADNHDERADNHALLQPGAITGNSFNIPR